MKIYINLFNFHENDEVMKVVKLVKINSNIGITEYLNYSREGNIFSVRGKCSDHSIHSLERVYIYITVNKG